MDNVKIGAWITLEGLNAAQQKVTVIVPCRNEANHIIRFLNLLFQQKLNGIILEVLIADGMSNDGTRELLNNYCSKWPHVQLIDNIGRIVSTGLNELIRNASGDIIIRMDVHTEYEPDYIFECVRILNESGAANVGGAWRASGTNYLQSAIALAFQSSFSCGGASSHNIDKEGHVDSVYLGCWKKETLENIGLFDEELVRNQDDELNLRISRSGGKIFQSPSIKSNYFPRSSLMSLLKQYMQYGYWKVRVIQKHKIPASVRHVIPGLFVFSCISLGVLSFISPPAFFLLKLLVSLYLVVNITASFLTCLDFKKMKYIPIMPILYSIFHVGYGYGFLRGVIDFVVFRNKKKNGQFTSLTRS